MTIPGWISKGSSSRSNCGIHSSLASSPDSVWKPRGAAITIQSRRRPEVSVTYCAEASRKSCRIPRRPGRA